MSCVVRSSAMWSHPDLRRRGRRALAVVQSPEPERLNARTRWPTLLWCAWSGGVDRLGLAGAGCDDPGFVGEGDELGAVVAVELAEDASDVRLGGEGADDEPAGDLRVAEAAGHELEDLA